MNTKKAQWGPDAIVGIVLLAILSIGGLFGLNLFVDGLAYDNLIRILDSEVDESCFFMMLPMIKDDYTRMGDKIEGESFNSMYEHFGVEEEFKAESFRFKNRFDRYTDGLITMPLGYFDIENPKFVRASISSPEKTEEIFEELYDELQSQNLEILTYCFYPVVYNPAVFEKPGISQFIIARER